MTTFLFWNLNKRPLDQSIATLAAEHAVNVVVLAESPMQPNQLLPALSSVTKRTFYYPRNWARNIQIYTDFSPSFLTSVRDDDGITIRRLRLPAQEKILLVAVHAPSKQSFGSESQTAWAKELSRTVREAEASEQHSRTVLVGDLNMNPFEVGLVGAYGLHAVMSRTNASKGTRTLQGKEYPFFYNPMWSHLGDAHGRPAGTHYYLRAEPVCYFWNTYDQVLLRPDLLPTFSDDVRILHTCDRASLLTDNGLPDKHCASDHLPILFSLDLDLLGAKA